MKMALLGSHDKRLACTISKVQQLPVNHQFISTGPCVLCDSQVISEKDMKD